MCKGAFLKHDDKKLTFLNYVASGSTHFTLSTQLKNAS